MTIAIVPWSITAVLVVLLLDKSRERNILKSSINDLQSANIRLKQQNQKLHLQLKIAAEDHYVLQSTLQSTIERHAELAKYQTLVMNSVTSADRFISTFGCISRLQRLRCQFRQLKLRSRLSLRLHGEKSANCVTDSRERLEKISRQCKNLHRNYAMRLRSMQSQVNKMKSNHILDLNKLNDQKLPICSKLSHTPAESPPVQLADYASSFCGAEILHETGSYKQRRNSIRELITDFWSSRLFISSASSILHPDIHPGQCWPCVPPCTVRIKLCHPTKVKAFSIHHIAASLSVSVYGITSAPRRIVFKIDDYQFEYEYQVKGTSKQIFQIDNYNTTEKSDLIEFEILSNWGHPHVACLYKIDIH